MTQTAIRNTASNGQFPSDELLVLPTTLLQEHASRVTELETMAAVLKKDFGWHYMLDLVWASSLLEETVPAGGTVLDAGAGTGLIQWWLADKDINVVSVDRMPRYFRPELRAWCPVIELESGKPVPSAGYLASSVGHALTSGHYVKRSLACAAAGVRDAVVHRQKPAKRATVRILEGDLMKLHQIESGSIDAVVSISSLEHNSPKNLKVVVQELLRILRPGGRIVATLGASGTEDWYHAPSSGWCYTESTLAEIFELTPGFRSNYADYDSLFKSLIECEYLRDNLGAFYADSGHNGMPWGRWDPQYQSVGVMKVKR